MSKQSSPWQQNYFWNSSLRQNEEAKASDIHVSFFLLKLRDSCPIIKNKDRVPASCFFLHKESSWLTKQTCQIPTECHSLQSGAPNIQASSSHHNPTVLTRPRTVCVQDERGRGPQTALYLSYGWHGILTVSACGTKAGMLLYRTLKHMTIGVGKLHLKRQ